MKRTYRDYGYDLWGNDKDGWHVNDVYRGDTVEIDDDKPLIPQLRKAGLLKKGIRETSILVEGEPGYTYYIMDGRKRTYGKPAMELRCES